MRVPLPLLLHLLCIAAVAASTLLASPGLASTITIKANVSSSEAGEAVSVVLGRRLRRKSKKRKRKKKALIDMLIKMLPDAQYQEGQYIQYQQ